MAQLEAAIQKELDAIRHTPPSQKELDRARNQLFTHVVEGLENLGGFGGRADMLNRYNQYLKDPGYLNKDMERYTHVTPASLQNTAKNYLAPNARAVVITEPQS